MSASWAPGECRHPACSLSCGTPASARLYAGLVMTGSRLAPPVGSDAMRDGTGHMDQFLPEHCGACAGVNYPGDHSWPPRIITSVTPPCTAPAGCWWLLPVSEVDWPSSFVLCLDDGKAADSVLADVGSRVSLVGGCGRAERRVNSLPMVQDTCRDGREPKGAGVPTRRRHSSGQTSSMLCRWQGSPRQVVPAWQPWPGT